MGDQYFSVHFKLCVCKIIATSAYPSRLFQLSLDIIRYQIVAMEVSMLNVNVYLFVSSGYKQNSDTGRSFKI